MTYRTGRQSPINIWETTDDGDVQVAMATTPHKAQRLVEAANRGLQAEAKLSVLREFFARIQLAAASDHMELVVEALSEATERLADELDHQAVGRPDGGE